MKRHIFVLALFFVVVICKDATLKGQPSEQINVAKIRAFGEHLFAQGDYLRAAMELERYLYYTQNPSDSVLFKVGLCHQLRERYDFAVKSFRMLAADSASQLYHPARLALRYNLMQLNAWSQLRALGFHDDQEFYFYYLATVHLDDSNIAAPFFEKVDNDSLRQRYLSLERERARLKEKSPLVAGALSVILPGAGKWYLQRQGDALFALGMTSLAAFVSYKAFLRDLNITGVITSGITLSFYLGSIYGSYIGTTLFNQEQKQEWWQKVDQLNPLRKNPYWHAWISDA